MSTVDPYPIVRKLLANQAVLGTQPRVTPRQLGEAAACFAAGIAALGLEPVHDGDATHPTVLRGRWLLSELRDHASRFGAVAEGGGRP